MSTLVGPYDNSTKVRVVGGQNSQTSQAIRSDAHSLCQHIKVHQHIKVRGSLNFYFFLELLRIFSVTTNDIINAFDHVEYGECTIIVIYNSKTAMCSTTIFSQNSAMCFLYHEWFDQWRFILISLVFLKHYGYRHTTSFMHYFNSKQCDVYVQQSMSAKIVSTALVVVLCHVIKFTQVIWRSGVQISDELQSLDWKIMYHDNSSRTVHQGDTQHWKLQMKATQWSHVWHAC